MENTVYPLPSTTPDMMGKLGLLVSRLIVAYLWITQLAWKMPPNFGCPSNFAVSINFQTRTTGLCDWAGLMAAYSKAPLHAAFVEHIFIPNIAWMGWGVWFLEAFVALSLALGLFSRLGALLGFAQAINLYIGLTAIPGQWYWTYAMLGTLQFIFLTIPPGRYYGIDAWLHPLVKTAAEQGSRMGLILSWVT